VIKNEIEETIKVKFEALRKELNERSRRLWAATEARALGHGGAAAVSRATGIAESTIRIGKHELAKDSVTKDDGRIRRKGGGRKQLEKEEGLLEALDALVEPTSRGDPMSPLRWTCKSTRKLAKELAEKGYKISHTKVGQLLDYLNYSLQGTQKRLEGKSHPDRDAQFKFINNKVVDFQKRGQPVISVDTKKKELIGNFSVAGKEYQPSGTPELVETYNFPNLAKGKGIPYGVYDITKNQGWVSVGIDHDTAKFAVHTIYQWWCQMGKHSYPDAKELLITADGGGSNGHRVRLWKIELQDLANKIGLNITVCHFPPGTSKWNKIEHRMFSYITKNWRGRPLTSYEVIVNLIANTTTEKGLIIKADLDKKTYALSLKVSDEELESVNLKRNDFHGEWNYAILFE